MASGPLTLGLLFIVTETRCEYAGTRTNAEIIVYWNQLYELTDLSLGSTQVQKPIQ